MIKALLAARLWAIVACACATVAALSGSALAYFTATGSVPAAAGIGSLSAPTLSTPTAGAGTVSLSWSSVSAPAAGTVKYYVSRSGGTVGGSCPSTAATATTSLSCQDAGLAHGVYTYTVTAVWQSWTATSTSVNVTVQSGAAAQLVFTQQPASSTGATAFPTQPKVTVEDAAGYVVTGDSSTVTLTIASNPGNGTLSGCSQLESAGVITFAGCAINTAANGYTLSASDGSLTSATSSSFNITVGPATQLAFTQQPSNGTGGVALPTQPKVAVEDAGGNVVTSYGSSLTVALGSNPTGTTISCSQSMSGGVDTFSGCTINPAATGYTVLVSQTGLSSATSAAFNISVGPATKLAFTQQPASSTGGTAFPTQPHVSVEDAGANVVTGDASTISLTIATNPSGGTLSACANSESSGVFLFTSCQINKSGTGYTLKATDGSLTSATSAAFNITVGAASQLVLSASTTSPTVGATDNLTLTAQDAGGNTVTTFTGSKSITFSGPANSPKGNAPTVTSSSGTAVSFGTAETITFSNGIATTGSGQMVMKLYDAQTVSIVANDSADGLSNGSGLSVTAGAASPSVMKWATCADVTTGYSSATCASPTLSNARSTLTGYIQLTDSYGNASKPSSTVTISLTDSNTTDYTLQTSSVSVTSASTTSGQWSDKKSATGAYNDVLTASASGYSNITLSITG